MTTNAERAWMDDAARAGCVVGNRGLGTCGGRVTVHHVAEGSGLRSSFATVGLCQEHHQGQAGLHGMGTKAFCRLYRPLGDAEWGLLAWAIEDVAKLRLKVPA
jgi:hypothetical protein